IIVNQWFRLERKSDVLIIDGRKGRGERLIPDRLRDGGIVKNWREAGVEDGIARPQFKSGFLLLGSAQVDVIERPDGTLIHRKRGGQLIEAKSHQREPAAEGRERLAEDGILLALQLCEKGGDGLIAGLVDTARGNELVDNVLDVLSAESRKCGRRNVKKLELVLDVQPDIPTVGVAYLEDFQIEHHFRPGTIQLSKKLGCGFQRRLRSAQRDRARCRIEARELELK